MKLTKKIRIFPTLAQKEVLWKLSEKCRLIYNFALAERRHAYRHGIKGVNYRKQQNDLPRIKAQYPEYRWVYCLDNQFLRQYLVRLSKTFGDDYNLRRCIRARKRSFDINSRQ